MAVKTKKKFYQKEGFRTRLILFLVMNKQFVAGITEGAVKG